MNKRTYGILAGVIGSAFGAWLWRRQRSSYTSDVERPRGTVIYDNTPTATPLSGEGVM